MTIVRAAAAVLLGLIIPAYVSAQQSEPSRVAVDSVVATDLSVVEGGTTAAGFTADAVASLDLGGGLQFVTRPFLQRQSGNGEWNAQVWLAEIRYERVGSVGVRVDGGYIPSPVGMANLLLRPHTNPTISLPASLFTALPRIERGGPRLTLLGPVYPLGVSATVSSLRWDLRGAVIDTSPSRPRRVFADASPPNPPRLTNVVLGGGMTPVVGVRLGASFTRGHWARASETLQPAGSRVSTIMTIEADVSYRHTRVQGEWTRDRFAVGDGHVTARGWFAQGSHSLSPRWFVAGRIERLAAPALMDAEAGGTARERQRFQGFEETVGYRITPELTFRVSHRLRRVFGSDAADHSGAMSLVWWRRWR